MRRFIAVLSIALASSAYADKKPAEKKPAAQAPAPKAEAKPASASGPSGAEAAKPAARHIKVGVTEAGFEPAEIVAKPNEALVLDVTRVTEETCATAIVVPDQKTRVELPLNQEVQVPIQAGQAGRIAFGCPMNLMIKGAVVVKE